MKAVADVTTEKIKSKTPIKKEKIITVGGGRLNGEVAISGAKNAVLPLMAAALLTEDECIINNAPCLDDVLVMLSVFKALGGRADFDGHQLRLNSRGIEPRAVKPEILRRIRASNLILGPLLARFKEAEIGACGGCSIGSRPMDIHFAGMEALGAKILPLAGGYFAFARQLKGTDIHLKFPSVGATENLLMAAALSEGQTRLHNAAAEPEIEDLAAFINAMGGRISGAGTAEIVIDGVKKLHGVEYTVMPDRIETGTFLLAGALLGGKIRLLGARAADVQVQLSVLRQMGVEYQSMAGEITVQGGPLKAVRVETAPHPGFPTDLQPILAAVLCHAEGESIIREQIFENRFGYINELKKLGAAIQIRDNCAIIKGSRQNDWRGAKLAAADLRAGAALVLAALSAEGESEITGVHYIDRGYEDLVGKLRRLGADIKRC